MSVKKNCLTNEGLRDTGFKYFLLLMNFEKSAKQPDGVYFRHLLLSQDVPLFREKTSALGGGPGEGHPIQPAASYGQHRVN